MAGVSTDLDTGTVERIVGGLPVHAPVVQLIDIKDLGARFDLLNHTPAAVRFRFRMILSDSGFYTMCLLHASLNALVLADQLRVTVNELTVGVWPH